MNTADQERRRMRVGTIAAVSYAVLLGLAGPAPAASLAAAARNGDVAAVRGR